MNGMNGNNGPQQQVSAQDVARMALVFLSRIDLKPAERGAYDLSEQLLKGIAEGSIHLAVPPQQGAPLGEAGAALGEPAAPPIQ